MYSPTFLLLLSFLFALGSCGDPRAVQFQTSLQHRSTSHIHDNSRPQRYASLYKAPAPYRSLGRPLLNSFIVTSRPLDLKNLDRKKDALENVSPTPSPAPAVEDGFHYIPQFKIECNAGRGPCSETITSPSSPTTPPTFKQHSQESITRFVQTLRDDGGNGIRRNGGDGSEEGSAPEGELSLEDGIDGGQQSSKLSKANLWYRPSPHRPPQNDKKGWVALDPVPWSSSKISKWTPDKNNPGSKPPEATRAPFPQRTPLPTETSYHRPTTFYQTGQGNIHWHSSTKPPRPHDSYQSTSSASNPIIITDGKDPEWPLTHSGPQRPTYSRPSNDRPQAYLQVHSENNFPNYYPDHRPSISHRPHGWGISSQQQDGASRRPQNYPTPVVYHDEPSPASQDSHSITGGGQWVVLSDTKEYKPKTADRRSYGRLIENKDVSPKISTVRTSRRMVKLMVLPSEGNLTTSHGGMLEVDGSFDTVDEDRRKRMLAQSSGAHNDVNDNKASPIVVHALTSNQGHVTRVDRAKAVMAAVGAGMVPATVAAILPIVLAQRTKRSVSLSYPLAEDIARNTEQFPMSVKVF